ncbi:MAG: hypothetical protein IPK50_19200 [Fibrobacterota bacterium]|nr:hypothetical protein [Fibrobacterota bacterium]QQS04393.1 MAG: hypothetical protein IPK50_19200 [Fibrobacterota bacterium]
MSRLTRLLTTAAALGLLQACDSDRIAGTNNETQTKGTFFRPDGKPAVGARVRVYAATQKETDSTTTQVTQAYVDANGNVALKLKPGHYSLIADDQSTGRALFIDSAFSDGDKVELPIDTLRPTGTITGHIRVQPMHSPSIAWVHLMRTNLYANVDSTGFFRITGVPAGNLDLVAVTHLSQYTPTHKLVRARPDSVIDADTIDLVYNGLPLVTGIVATYDTLSGVVTVGWKDTAYARKSGYVIYRQDGPASWGAPSERGVSESAQFRDTVFGGFGATPSRYDSAEFDLTYWVGAKATDLVTPPPLWNKATLHVKSPALAQRWKLDWTTIPLPGKSSPLDHIDTLPAGIGLLSVDESIATLRIATPAGIGNAVRFPVPAELTFGPVFWKGRIWMARGCAPTWVEHDIWQSNGVSDTIASWSVFDSVRILSSENGVEWDSTTIAVPTDSADGFAFHKSQAGLVLSAWYVKDFMGVGRQFKFREAKESFDGKTWHVLDGNRTFIAGIEAPDDFWLRWFRKVEISSAGDGSSWTIYSTSGSFDGPAAPVSWIIPGESIDTAKSVLKVPSDLSMWASPNLLAIGVDGNLHLATRERPKLWQRVFLPAPVRSFCTWRGQLVALGGSSLSFGAITEAP